MPTDSPFSLRVCFLGQDSSQALNLTSLSPTMALPTSTDDARETLRQWREDNVRRSADVVALFEDVLVGAPDGDPWSTSGALGDEYWMVLEQVAVAAMDVHRRDLVDRCLKEIKRQFDLDSFRVRRLYAMRYEMIEDWENAIKIYDLILEEDETNSAARKRKVAILKQQGETSRAISELNKYLKEFMSDTESWMELCDLYIQEQDYGKAAFCCEELILHNPNNHIYFQKYAEIRYTQGGFENIELAKAYFSKAVTFNPNNMRALYGLLLTSSQLASSPKCTAQKKREYLKTVVWAAKQITKRYEEKKSPVPLGFLESLMGQLQVTPPGQQAN